MAQQTAATKRPPLILIVLGILVALWVIGTVLGDRDPAPSGGRGTTPEQPPTVTITYRLEGSARSASITYTDGAGNIQQQNGIAVPMVSGGGSGNGIAFRNVARGEFVQFSAQNDGERGDLDCSILANSTVINTGHASGAYAIVSCSARVP